ncbi:MAG TPA: glycerophosphodiester phosphodiesterase [Vicinamibacteria bacterium]|nr:glycerophosphodiester phosphodiesterase [Vicinamibacteria bacterium]
MLPATVGFLLALSLAAPAEPAAVQSKPEAARTFDLQAHRGGRGLWPENTLVAFAGALSLGVDTLELDCAVTKDGVVVISHDPLLNPEITRDASGKFLETHGPSFFSLTWADLQRYDVGRMKPGTKYAEGFPDQKARDGLRIPRLADVFALVKKSGNTTVRFNIETKITPDKPGETLPPQAFAEAVVKAVREAKMEKRAAIQSFDWRTLAVVQKLAPEIETVALTTQRPNGGNVQLGAPGASPSLGGLDVDDFGGSLPKVVKASGARVWSPNWGDVVAAQVEEAHALGLKVIPWTINESADMEKFVDMGVDGIITDRPDRLREVLKKKNLPLPNATPVQP